MDRKRLAKLVKMVKKGNKDAFAEIYSYFAQDIHYFSFRITKNDHDASDVVQETMLSLYKNIQSLKNPEAVTSFVRKTAYNYCLMTIRKQKNIIVDDDDFFEGEFEENEEFLPESYVEGKEKREEIIRLLDELPEQQRIVMMMFYFDGVPSKEIAELLNISDKAVRGRLFRGRENMKTALLSNGMKGVALSIVSAPVLSKILSLESKAAFSPSVHSQTWTQLASKLNFAPEEIASTLSTAVMNNSVTTTATSVATTATVGTTASIITTKGVVTTIVALGVIGGSTAMIVANPEVVESVKESSVAVIESVKQGGGESTPNAPTISFDSPIETNTVENPPIISFDRSDPPAEIAPHQSNEVPPKPPPQPATEEQAQSQPSTPLGSGGGSPSNPAGVVVRGNYMPIVYSRGATITPEDVIKKSQISYPEGTVYQTERFELIDSSVVREYIVFYRFSYKDRSEEIAIIISVE